MRGIRQIRQRRKAAESIGRLTRTMQIVSTARFKSIHRQWLADADYHDALAQAGYLLVSSETPLAHPLLQENESKKNAILVIGSKAGLCGGYNTNIWHMVQRHLKIAETAGRKLEVVAPSSRLLHLLRSRGVKVSTVYEDLHEIPSAGQVSRIADGFVERYMAGELDTFGIVYMRFHSAGHQQAQTMTIMPLSDLIDHLLTTAKVLWPWDLSFEDFDTSPSADQMIESLARMIMYATIRACFLDALLSEHVARMTAMRSASKNADTMIGDLSQQYNRARQTQITGELLDIIGGTGALG
jgi:F-type H+-transporting ATPase subunit gamma